MPRFFLAPLLLSPLLACAECGFANSGDTLTLVVGANTTSCFKSEAFRREFRASLVASVQAMDREEPENVRKRAFDDRNSRSQKLWTLAERNYQSTFPSGRYFGQKR